MKSLIDNYKELHKKDSTYGTTSVFYWIKFLCA